MIKIQSYGDSSKEFIDDLFTYIVDGGLEDIITDNLSNTSRIVSMAYWDAETNEITFEVIPILKIQSDTNIVDHGELIGAHASIEEENLILNITYAGGCKVHKFELVWDGLYFESSPVQVNLSLHHSNENDNCKARKNKKIAFSLADIKSSRINLMYNNKPIQSIRHNI